MYRLRIAKLGPLTDGTNQNSSIYRGQGFCKKIANKRFETLLHLCTILHTNRVHLLTHLLKFSILLGGIRVIESHDHFAVVHVLVILIQQSSLGMTDMEIPVKKVQTILF